MGPWAEAMARVRATDPRNGRPSWNTLAEMSGVSTSTLTRMVTGKRKTSLATITRVAEALRVTPDTVLEWLGVASIVTPYQVPDEVHLLTPRQQKALTEFIRAIAAEQGGGEHGGDTTATSAAVPIRKDGTAVYEPVREAARRTGRASQTQRARSEQDRAGEESQDL